MSYFEVYNEKIHDLLVTRDEPNQRRMPVSGLQLTETTVNFLNCACMYVMFYLPLWPVTHPNFKILLNIAYF